MEWYRRLFLTLTLEIALPALFQKFRAIRREHSIRHKNNISQADEKKEKPVNITPAYNHSH
jgi:hypothetical protein